LSRGTPDIKRLALHFFLDCEEAPDPLEEFSHAGALMGLVQVKDLAVRMGPGGDFNFVARAVEFIVAGGSVRLQMAAKVFHHRLRVLGPGIHGAFWYSNYQGGLKVELFVALLKK